MQRCVLGGHLFHFHRAGPAYSFSTSSDCRVTVLKEQASVRLMCVYMCVQEQRCSLRARRSRPPAWDRLSGILSGQELVYHAFAPSPTVFCRSTSRSSMGLGRRCAANCSGLAVSVLTYVFHSAAQHLDAESPVVCVCVCACVNVCVSTWRTKGGCAFTSTS